MSSRPQEIPAVACPSWCTSPHDDGVERRHLAELRSVPATTDGIEAHAPNLYFDLRQEPGEVQPLIHVELDEKPVARLTVAEALNAGTALIFLAMLAGDS